MCLKKPSHIVGDGGGDGDGIAADGVGEGQPRTVKTVARENRFVGAVHRVPRERIAEPRQVHADLVGAAACRHGRYPRCAGG